MVKHRPEIETEAIEMLDRQLEQFKAGALNPIAFAAAVNFAHSINLISRVEAEWYLYGMEETNQETP